MSSSLQDVAFWSDCVQTPTTSDQCPVPWAIMGRCFKYWLQGPPSKSSVEHLPGAQLNIGNAMHRAFWEDSASGDWHTSRTTRIFEPGAASASESPYGHARSGRHNIFRLRGTRYIDRPYGHPERACTAGHGEPLT